VIQADPVPHLVREGLKFKKQVKKTSIVAQGELTCPRLYGDAVPPGSEEKRITTPSSIGSLT